MKCKSYLILSLFFSIIFFSCEKYNQIDNSATIIKPYVLYTGGLKGTVFKTNDGVYFRQYFPIDNSPVRQIEFVDSNVFYLKKYAYVSQNDGEAFELVNNHPHDYYDAFYEYFIPNQMKYDESQLKFYLCTATGLEKSNDFGKTFIPEANWGTGGPIIPKSITHLQNEDLYIIKDTQNIYKLTAGTGNWNKVTQITPLPTDTAIWYFSTFNNQVIAVDYRGHAGVWYSPDGADWKKFNGVLGNGKKILFANQPEGSSDLYIGRDSMGLFKTNSNAFATAATGLPWFAKVQFVEGKTVHYRSGLTKHYLYCATNLGLYVSESDGADWRLIRSGEYSTLR